MAECAFVIRQVFHNINLKAWSQVFVVQVVLTWKAEF